jgi:hypothetical protein
VATDTFRTALRNGLGSLFFGATVLQLAPCRYSRESGLQPEQTAALRIPQWVTIVRIPVQLLVLAGAWFATSKSEGR